MGENLRIPNERRDWVIGYLTAAGYSESVLGAAAAYEDGDSLEDIVDIPQMSRMSKVLLYDALRACAMASANFAGQ